MAGLLAGRRSLGSRYAEAERPQVMYAIYRVRHPGPARWGSKRAAVWAAVTAGGRINTAALVPHA